MNKDSRLVYSTDGGRVKPARETSAEPGNSRSKKAGAKKGSARQNPIKDDGILRIRRETSGRKGKGVTTISGFTLPENELKTVAKQLKQICGTGGTVKQGIIEIQGDHRTKIQEMLSKAGYQVKLAGG